MEVRAGYKQTEIGVIPEDWEVRLFGEIASLRNQNYNSKVSGGHEFCIELEHIGQGTGILAGASETSIRSSTKKVFNENDILFGRLRAYLRKYCLADRPGVASSEIWPIAANTEVTLPKYLLQIVQTNGFMKAASEAYGTHMPRSDWSIVKAYGVPLPSNKGEQTAIAAALSDADALISSLEKLIAKKQDIKKGAMQQLLPGKKRLPGFSGEWKRRRLGDLGFIYGGLFGKKKQDFGVGPARYVTFLNVMNNLVVDRQRFDLVRVLPSERQNRVLKGDLFFNSSSETPEEVGMCAALLDETHDVYLNSFCLGFRLHDAGETNGLYLAHFFRSEKGRELMYPLAQGATRYDLSGTRLLNLEFEMPCLKEQTAIAEVLSDMDAEIEALEHKLEKYRLTKEGMMQELLTGRKRLICEN